MMEDFETTPCAVMQAVVVARAMDTYDRLKWLQERCRFEQALEVAERDPTLKPATRAEVGHQARSCKTCLKHPLLTGSRGRVVIGDMEDLNMHFSAC